MTSPLQTARQGIDRLLRRCVVHFLHIGKAAGTQVEKLADAINASPGSVHIRKHGHAVLLRHLPKKTLYFFSIRRPDTRFRSGFYSRKRQGLPAHNVPWTEAEARAFAAFEHANDLAEALFGPRGAEAAAAMLSIQHAALHQVDWFKGRGFFLQDRPPLAILRQEHFDTDLQRLRVSLGLETLPDLPAQAHRSDYTDTPPLSDKATTNLRRWYAADDAFYDMCEGWLTSRPVTLEG